MSSTVCDYSLCVCTVEGMFETISEFQKLYPDPELSDSEGEGEEEGGEEEEEGESVDLASGDFFTTPEGLDQLTTEGRAVLAHLENIVQLPSPAEFQEMVSNGTLMLTSLSPSN